jgi:hypothetical protein
MSNETEESDMVDEKIELDVEKLQLKNGDILVCKVPELTSVHELEHCREGLNRLLERMGLNKVQVIVSVQGMDLEVLKQHVLKEIYDRLENLEKEERVDILLKDVYARLATLESGGWRA